MTPIFRSFTMSLSSPFKFAILKFLECLKSPLKSSATYKIGICLTLKWDEILPLILYSWSPLLQFPLFNTLNLARKFNDICYLWDAWGINSSEPTFLADEVAEKEKFLTKGLVGSELRRSVRIQLNAMDNGKATKSKWHRLRYLSTSFPEPFSANYNMYILKLIHVFLL